METVLIHRTWLARLLQLVWLVVALSCVAGAAPSFLIRSWQTGEGLPHNSPTRVRQAGDGYLWIATNSGVSRFDGVRFENFGTREGLPSNQVLSLHVDSRSRVWAGTTSGVAVREGGRWRVPSGLAMAGQVWSIGEAKDGTMLFGAQRGMLCWSPPGDGRWVEGLPDPNIRDFEVDPSGAVWVVCRTGVMLWRDGALERIPLLDRAIAGREVWGMEPIADGRWVVFGTDLLLIGGGDVWADQSAAVPARGGIHNSVLAAPDGSLWVGTRNRGVSRWLNGDWAQIDASSGLSHDDVRDLHVDSEGGLWICTNGGGINLVRQRWLDVFGISEGLGRHVTTALACDPAGRILAGTDGGGVKVFDGLRFVPEVPPEDLKDPFVWSLLVQPSGELWVGTFRHGILRWKDRPLAHLSTGLGLADHWIPVQMRDREGWVWVGGHNGSVCRVKDGRPEEIRKAPPVGAAPVTGLLEDRRGVVWMGTSGDGLWRYHEGAWEDCRRSLGFHAAGVVALHEDGHGRVWVGTSGGGLAMFEADRFHCWDTRHGIACDTVLQILDDGRGGLWLGTNLGLQRVMIDDLLEVAAGRRDQLQIADLFGRADGLVSTQFSSGHGNLAVRDRQGDLWFSLAGGALRVRPGGHEPRTQPPPLRVESVAGGDGEGLWQYEWPAAAARRIVTDWPVRSLEFRFSAPSFLAPEKLRFRYRLAGLDDIWRDAGPNRAVTFPSLPPGRFRFEVMAAMPGSPWSGTPVSLALEVRPRFWQGWWFRFGCLVVGAGGVGVAVRWWSLRRIRRRMEVLEQERKIEGERARIAQDLHDDLGATLTEINFLGALGAAGEGSSVTRQRLEGIVERAQRMAKSLDEIVWTVNPTNDSLSSTISYLCSRTQESLSAGGLRCRLDVAEELPVAVLDSEVRHHLLMAVNEAVNNSMKHAGAKELRLVVRHVDGLLLIVVQDDGCGFDPAEVPGGRNGLGNMRRRIESVGGGCRIDSRPGHGARVCLELPLSGRRGVRATASPRSGGSA